MFQAFIIYIYSYWKIINLFSVLVKIYSNNLEYLIKNMIYQVIHFFLLYGSWYYKFIVFGWFFYIFSCVVDKQILRFDRGTYLLLPFNSLLSERLCSSPYGSDILKIHKSSNHFYFYLFSILRFQLYWIDYIVIFFFSGFFSW